jgi:tetratricopeptide (TPR) repeat protein
MGAFVEARRLLEQGLDTSASAEGQASPIVRQNNEITATSFLAWTLWLLGYPERATSTAEQALVRARGTGHVPLIAFVSFAQAFLATAFEVDRELAGTKAEDAIAYCFEHGITTFEHWARFCQGAILTRQGDPERAIEVMRASMEAALQNDAKLFLPRHLGHLAIAHAALGEAEVGLGLLEEANVIIERTGERLFEAEVYRLRGELLLRLQKSSDAEMMLERALTVARTQQARMWELRAATNLARLWGEGGRGSEARDLLASVYSWFTEGFDMPDLKEAKVVLKELA